MVPTRASGENELTPVPRTTVVTNPAPAAESASQALALTRVWRRDARWLGGVALVYAALVVITVLTLNAYFAQTWDAVTFVGAGKIAGSSGWAALYAQSRADNYWPYAYPPLHAFLVAPFVALAGSAPAWLLVRVPPLLFDLALGVLLYGIVWQKTRRIALARLALAAWLLNPVTWYDTAVQGHFESEWLFFVVLGYFLYSVKRGWILPTLILAVGFLLKQNVILFALPFWALLFFEREKSLTRRGMNVAASAFVFAIPIALVSLPFLLYSNDYWFMNVQYVSEAPLQTQSWLVGLAGLFGAENFLLRASSGLTLAAAGVIAFFGARRGMNLWAMGLLIVLAFFLLSKKVVGYYYVMSLPFALATLLPLQRARAVTLLVIATAFIFVAPYFASWADQTHWLLYALLGIGNSALWLGLFIWLWRNHAHPAPQAQAMRVTAFVSAALFFAASAAALTQPLIASATSPIRAPLIAPGSQTQVSMAFLVFALLVGFGIVAARFFSRSIARVPSIPFGAYIVVVLLAPLYFLTFAMTKEATAGFEALLRALGR
ncbi:MAG: hypothetical protein HDKAJFGB_02511 [Anaerolineae bacterium]|nr:hypothetical protein [Anaerolineae bacterium]